MYIGYLLVILSEFFLFGSSSSTDFFVSVVLLIHLAVVYIEEPALEKKFGTEYIDYKKRVPRWILKIR